MKGKTLYNRVNKANKVNKVKKINKENRDSKLNLNKKVNKDKSLMANHQSKSNKVWILENLLNNLKKMKDSRNKSKIN